MKQKKNKRKKQRGQFLLEGILLMFLFLGAALIIQKAFSDKPLLGMIVAGPWEKISGFMTNGVWLPEKDGTVEHPHGHGVGREGDSRTL